MGRWCELLPCRWWIICIVTVASAVGRPEGLSIAHSSVSSAYSSQGKEIVRNPGQLENSESSSAPSSTSFLNKGHERPRSTLPKVENRQNVPIASGPPRHSKPSPPNKPPVIPRMAPITAFASPSINLHGSAEPPKSITAPVRSDSGRRYGIPVSSPYSHPANNLPSKAHSVLPKYLRRHHASLQYRQGHSPPPIQAPAPSPSPSTPDFSHSPTISPGSHPPPSSEVLPPPIWLLPPPPPNLDCNFLVCAEPYTNPSPGSPCICVLPIRVEIRLSVTLYTFFPLVPEFAKEIAVGINMKQNQVRIMGANVASEQSENTIVLVDMVPSDAYFDNASAFSTFEKFWHKDIVINKSLFGDYAVSYVLYPGLPPSPPRAPTNIADGAFGNNNNGSIIKPLGVDVGKMKEKNNRNLIAVIVLSSFVGLTICVGAAWLLLLKHKHHTAARPHKILPSLSKSSGTTHMMLGNRSCSESASLSSSVATYNGSAKTFTLAEIEEATNRFDETRIIGEGGFGRVYQGKLEDGTRVAVKVLKRDDRQGGREFFAEIEMLSRLHHRNLVKLIGICIEEHTRCLVYELIPNGSVESHLHGTNKETDPLDWNARTKIALGAARALAYLHEDSSPRVIHRDFKSSNILLEHDYTPKVSDFGLARTALEEGNLHISTRVMGTFGYVAPEYAMTGHLLVKSDVYSYGVVLLELLTGRKPIDMSRPSGQENLVTWARPLLTNMDSVETIIDPALGMDVPIDSVAKVAAIASMCVQPEVSHRPFMGEVVQALKLVCNESNSGQNKEAGSYSQDEFSNQYATAGVSSNRLDIEYEGMLSASSIPNRSTRFDRDEFSSFQRHSTSGPLIMGKSREFWQRLRSFSTGSVSEHGAANRFDQV